MTRIDWHPPDPVQASRVALERVREALKRYDPLVNVWWSPNRGHQTGQPGRWRIVRFFEAMGEWRTLFYWEGPQGEYRPLYAEPILNQLRHDEAQARKGLRAVIAALEEQSKALSIARRMGLTDVLVQHAKELSDVMVKGKQVFAPGYVRKRNFGESLRGGGWAEALVRPEKYAKLSTFDKAVVDRMRTTGYEP